jgi:predicted AlkP superfamily phosphohydrolase/phosphomutase
VPDRPTVLAVGIDAAEPTLVLDLIERGRLPALARLREEGSWASVHSPAHIGSGAVWPTFMTGEPPERHGVYGDFNWLPQSMSLVKPLADRLHPFWAPLEDEGLTVGVLDVEFAPHVGLSRGFEVTEWAAHYSMQGRTAISPPEIASAVHRDHPFSSGRFEPGGEDRVDPEVLASGCIEGAVRRGELAERLLERTRPDLAVIVFVEAHRAAEDLWHTVEPDHPLYEGLSAGQPREGLGLAGVYEETDRQVGRLMATVGDDAAVVVFSLHGMGPARGMSGLLEPVLRELGFAQPARRGGRSLSDLGRGALAAVKRATPDAVKRMYHRRVPRDTRYRLAAQTMLPVLDWSRTRAFALPTDQHGWVRINLREREARGAVAPGDYEATCQELQQVFRGLRTKDGRPVVHDVIRADPSGSPPELLPDLVIHWSDAALDRPVRLEDPAIEVWPIASESTGQHRFEGFCVARGLDQALGESVEAAELHRLLRDACVPRAARPPWPGRRRPSRA